MDKNHIPIFCHSCRTENQIPVEGSTEDVSLSCSRCGAQIYWYNCPECGTGFSSSQAEWNCPDCSKIKEETLNRRKPIFSKPCPWCGASVNTAALFLTIPHIETCPSCNKNYEVSSVGKAISLFLLYTISLSGLFKQVFSPPTMAEKMAAIILIIGGGIILFLNLLDVKRYDP